MDSNTVLQRSAFFFCLSLPPYLSAHPIELWFTEHFETPIQFIPFVLSGLGLLAVIIVLVWPLRLSCAPGYDVCRLPGQRFRAL